MYPRENTEINKVVVCLLLLLLFFSTCDKPPLPPDREAAHLGLKGAMSRYLLSFQGRIQDFFYGGCTRLLLYFNTNKPHSFWGGGGAHPLHFPPRSAPAF